MISQLNHLPPLNGNNMKRILFFISACFLIACGSSKKTTRSNTQKVRPRLGGGTAPSSNKATGKVDTIQWTEIDKSKDYYDAIEDLDLEKKSSYDIALFFPFNLDQDDAGKSTDTETNMGRKTEYYSGVLMALDQLESEGINLNVKVFDSESGTFGNKLQECKNMDVIIGPSSKEKLQTVANFGLNNDVTVISPWYTSKDIAKNNPNFVQLVPSLREHFNKIVLDVKSKYNDDQVFLLGRKSGGDRGEMSYIQKIASAINNDGNPKPFQEFYMEYDSLRIGETAFDSIFYEDKTTVFIMPHWSFQKHEETVYHAVRKMSGEKGMLNVVVYGMPILYESERVKFEHYKNLRMRIARSSYVDKQNVEVINFRKSFYSRFNGLPSEEAYKGFDMMLFVGRHLYNYGRKFQYYVEDYDANLMQTKYDVQKVFPPNSGDKFDDLQYFQNKHLYILTFEDDKFVAY